MGLDLGGGGGGGGVVMCYCLSRPALYLHNADMFLSKVNSVTERMEWEAPEVIESELQEESDVSNELFR